MGTGESLERNSRRNKDFEEPNTIRSKPYYLEHSELNLFRVVHKDGRGQQIILAPALGSDRKKLDDDANMHFCSLKYFREVKTN